MRASRAILIIAALSFAAPVAAQVPKLTVEEIYSGRLSASGMRFQWMDDGQQYTIVARGQGGTTDLYGVDVRSGERELLVRGSELVPADGRQPILIDQYTFSADGSKLLIGTAIEPIWRYSTRGKYYVWDFKVGDLQAISARPGKQQFAKLSPDGSRVAFVRDNNIYVTDLATGSETALTADGDADVLNGMSDWVYEEELELYDAFRWSPDGRRVAFWRFDQSNIPPFYLIDETKLYPELVPVRYPKAGTDNSQVSIGIIELANLETTWVDTKCENDCYLARMDFAYEPNEIWIQRLNRHQNRMDVLLADVTTGKTRNIISDTDEAWIRIDEHELIWIKNGTEFLYPSERGGFSQLYLFSRDGRLIRKLTTGDWDVLGVYGVDESRGLVYFTAAADGPLVRPLYRIGLDGHGLERISGTRGSHRISFDPTFTYYADTYSEAGVPPQQMLRAVDGELIRALADSDAIRRRLDALRVTKPEFIKIPTEDGIELNAWLIKPPDFDPTKTYPLLMYVYGGPGSQTVTDAWGRDRYLWHQLLAQEGYLVASVDNRGTGARGVAFEKLTYLNLGKFESDDQIAAARYLGGLPYVDESRIGIWGWSYGGYMAALSVFRGGDVFKAAISVAPVTDWRLYDTIYTERYMRTPEENQDGYAQSAPQAYADRLEGRLLLIHGTGDDNVHPQNSLQLIQLLEQANKQFDFRLYPNKTHSIGGETTRINLFTLMTEFVKNNL